MKKIPSFVAGVLLVSALLSGCGSTAVEQAPSAQTNVDAQAESVEPVQATKETPENTEENTPENTENLSDEIEFGSYYEDAAGSNQAPIFWQILGESDGSVLLLTEHIIDARPFNLTKTETDWENSTLREWLNNEFYQMAFDESEQQSLKAGTEQNDLVFLLSDEEVKRYLPEDSARTALPTPYAVKQGVYTNEVGESAWWLRSPVEDKTQTSYISSGGSFGNRPHYVDENIIGVRPAIWVDASYLLNAEDAEAQTAPDSTINAINVKAIWEQYDADPESRQPVYYGDHITATGIVRYIGEDSHGTPSMELAETENGTGYVLGVFGSYEAMEAASVGDLVTFEGDFHIFGSDNMVVIKNTKLLEVTK